MLGGLRGLGLGAAAAGAAAHTVQLPKYKVYYV